MLIYIRLKFYFERTLTMKKKNKITLSLALLLMIGAFNIIGRRQQNDASRFGVNAEITLQKTIDFEDLTSGNMSATAKENSFYGGLIVADGRVTKTLSAKIDDNTLGMRIPASSTTVQPVVRIQVSGYTKIVVDIKQERTHTKISTGCGQLFTVSSNSEIIRDIEIPTYGYHEITLTFYTETEISSKMDYGLDNIRFYGPGTGSGGESSSSNESEIIIPSTSDSEIITSSSESSELPVTDYITIRDMADYLADKNTHYPLSNAFIEKYQQASGGYIAYAKQLGLLVDKAQHEPNQKWHFFDSWMYPSIEQGSLSWSESAKSRVYTKLLCPELLLWIYEATEVPTEKIVEAKAVAEAGKEAGTHISTLAKNMRAVVPWEDIQVTLDNHLMSR